MIKIVIIIFIAHFAIFNINAQNSTNSPLSIFGIGEVESRDFGRTTGMGSVGIGFKSENYLNRNNPAAISTIDTLRFVLDVSAAVKISEFSTTTQNVRNSNFNFKNMAVGVRLSKHWTTSVGLSPYSGVGYNLKADVEVKGTTGYSTALFNGNGGVNKFYWTNAFEPFRNFSVGITSSYLFGSITHEENYEAFNIVKSNNISKIIFDFGLQYSQQIGSTTNLTIGGVYGYKSDMSIQRNKVLGSYGALIQDVREPDVKMFLPENYGVGFSVIQDIKDSEWIFAADYQRHDWSANNLRHKGGMAYADSEVFSAGLQMIPNKRRAESYMQFMRYQVGVRYGRSPLSINGFQVEDYSASIGLGFPFMNASYLNLAATVGESGTGQRGGITERYILISLNISLIDRWFTKRQWD